MTFTDATHLPHFLDLVESAPSVYDACGLIPITRTEAEFLVTQRGAEWTVFLSDSPFVAIAPAPAG